MTQPQGILTSPDNARKINIRAGCAFSRLQILLQADQIVAPTCCRKCIDFVGLLKVAMREGEQLFLSLRKMQSEHVALHVGD